MIGYTITYNPIKNEYSYMAPAKIEKEINQELYVMALENPKEAIPRLEELRALYPDHPRIYNYLATALASVGNRKKAAEMVEENYRRNPNYLFARMNYAEICLRRGHTEKIPEIFDNKFDLKLLYPERKTFHITEVVSFFGLIGLYYKKINDIEKAENMLTILEHLDPDNQITSILQTAISRANWLRRLKGFFRRWL